MTINFVLSIGDLDKPKKKIFNLLLKRYNTIFNEELNRGGDDEREGNASNNKIDNTDIVVGRIKKGDIKYDKISNKFYGKIFGDALIKIKTAGAVLDRRDGKYKLEYGKLNKTWQQAIDFMQQKKEHNGQIISKINKRLMSIKFTEYQSVLLTQKEVIFNILMNKMNVDHSKRDIKQFIQEYKRSIGGNYKTFEKNLISVLKNQEKNINSGAVFNKSNCKLYMREVFNESKKYVEDVLKELFYNELKDMSEENDVDGFYWGYEWPLTTERPYLEHLKNCIDSMKLKKKFKFKDIQKNTAGKKWHSILPGYHKGCRCTFISDYKRLPLNYLKSMENYYNKHKKK